MISLIESHAAGASEEAAPWLARRIGLINTMVFTHLPANAFLVLVPLMPNLTLALLFLMLRAALSHLDVPARTSYIMAVVSPGERPLGQHDPGDRPRPGDRARERRHAECDRQPRAGDAGRLRGSHRGDEQQEKSRESEESPWTQSGDHYFFPGTNAMQA